MAEEEKLDLGPEGEGDGEDSPENGQKKGNKLLIIIVLAVVLIAAAGAGAFFLMSGSDESVDASESAEEVVPVQTAFFFEIPEILVNLASSGSATRYLKLRLNLEVSQEIDLVTLEQLMPRVVDDFQLYLRQLRVEDLNGSAGIYRLKEDLLIRANQSAAPVKVQNVLFKEVLIQ